MSRNCILLCVISAVLFCLLLPLGQVVMFDGHYTLTVRFLEPETIDFSSVRLAPCWNAVEADYAVSTGSAGEASFQIGKAIGENSKAIHVPCSGRSIGFGWVTAYHEPPYLIVECRFRNAPETLVRRQFTIPQGHGDHELVVSLQE